MDLSNIYSTDKVKIIYLVNKGGLKADKAIFFIEKKK